MTWETIRKRPDDYAGASLANYDECAKTFSWTQAHTLLDGLPGGGLNIAYEAIDRRAGKIAGGEGLSRIPIIPCVTSKIIINSSKWN